MQSAQSLLTTLRVLTGLDVSKFQLMTPLVVLLSCYFGNIKKGGGASILVMGVSLC